MADEAQQLDYLEKINTENAALEAEITRLILVGLLTTFAGSTLAGSPLVSATDVGEGSSGLGFVSSIM